MTRDEAIIMLRIALDCLLNATMHKDHPTESRMAMDALEATKEYDSVALTETSAPIDRTPQPWWTT